MTLGEIKQKLAPIEALAHPKQNEYLRNIKKWKMAILYRLSKKVPLNGIVVEIGTRYGSTAILMALTTKPSVKIHCIELDILPELAKHIKEFGMSGKIAIWVGKSYDVGKLWVTPIDLLFIDGDHSYKGVMSDNKTWIPYVKKGGIIVWHDYYNKLPGCQEAGLATDDFLKKSKEDFEIIMPETAEKVIRVVRKDTPSKVRN